MSRFPFYPFRFRRLVFQKGFWKLHCSVCLFAVSVNFWCLLGFQYQVHLDWVKNQNENPENGIVEKKYDDERYGKLRQIVTYKNHKINGEQIVYCANETILSKGNFEDGKEIDEHFKREGGCNSLEGYFTINIYQPAGEMIETKRYEDNQLMYHFFEDSDYKNNGMYTQFSYQWNAEKTKLFLAGEIVSTKRGAKQINRKYDETGKLISEKVLPEVAASPASKITK